MSQKVKTGRKTRSFAGSVEEVETLAIAARSRHSCGVLRLQAAD
jgi:hypothetical protein